jgi:hypothetical protein
VQPLAAAPKHGTMTAKRTSVLKLAKLNKLANLINRVNPQNWERSALGALGNVPSTFKLTDADSIMSFHRRALNQASAHQ